MKTLNLIQGSSDWKAHRATAFNASDAPAMLGISKYKSRSALIKERATGIVPEVDDATQRRFNDGHRFEALARPIAEQIIGEELSPITGAEGKYSASFDGITFDGDVIFEHKTMNASLRDALFSGSELEEQYRAQMEHQLMVSGAEKCLFMASTFGHNDELIEEMHCWYVPDGFLRKRIVDGWTKFEEDIANYSPSAEAEKVTATAVMALPSLSVTIKGEVTNSNLPVFVSEADRFLAGIKTVLETDQDFADAESNVKACKAAEDGIEQTKKAITAQATSIDEVMRTMDMYKEKLSTVRLKLDKLVKSEKESRKLAIVSKAREDFAAHIAALEEEIKPIRLTAPHPDFGLAIKGLKSLTSMQEAVDTALRDGKFSADTAAKDYRKKLVVLAELCAGRCPEEAVSQQMLVPDLQQVISKPLDDFTLLITSRIDAQKKAEAEKLAAERARMEAEATAKAEREAAAKIAEAEERGRAEERAKAESEQKAREKLVSEQAVLSDKVEADAKANRHLDDLEDRMLAEQEAAAKKKTPEGEAGMPAGARPAAASQTEHAAPIATVHPIRKERQIEAIYTAAQLLDDALSAMAELHDSMKPDENEENALVSPEAFRRFVDAHARLMFERERMREAA